MKPKLKPQHKCKECQRNYEIYDMATRRIFGRERALKYRVQYLSELLVDLQQEIMLLTGMKIMDRPTECEDCGKKKVLYNVDLRLSKGGSKVLCQSCWQKREAPFVRGNYKSQWD